MMKGLFQPTLTHHRNVNWLFERRREERSCSHKFGEDPYKFLLRIGDWPLVLGDTDAQNPEVLPAILQYYVAVFAVSSPLKKPIHNINDMEGRQKTTT